MLLSKNPRRILAYSGAVDMRKSFSGLIAVTRQILDEDALSGDAYLFFNRAKTILKMLWWDRTGWCVFAKRIERGTFELRSSDAKQSLSEKELGLLLDGVFRRRK